MTSAEHFAPLPDGFASGPRRSGQYIDSQVFGSLTAGGTITGATFVGADFYSDNWNGAIPPSLRIRDSVASLGFALDGSSGGAQFINIFADGGELKTLDILGTLTMGTDGLIRTAESGQRIELANSDANFIYFYSGDADEELAGRIWEATNGAGVTRTVQFALGAPYINVNDQGVAITVRSASADATTFAPGVVIGTTPTTDPGNGSGLAPTFNIQNGINMLTDGDVQMTAGDLFVDAGDIKMSASAAVGFGTSYDDAIYQVTDGQLGIKTAGTKRFSVSTTHVNCVGSTFFRLPVKATTGDPSGQGDGDVYVNTFDNKVRVYADSAWRDLVTW